MSSSFPAWYEVPVRTREKPVDTGGLRSACPDWKTVSESPPKQDCFEESFQNKGTDTPGESDHRNCGQGKSFNLRQQRAPKEARPHKCEIQRTSGIIKPQSKTIHL